MPSPRVLGLALALVIGAGLGLPQAYRAQAQPAPAPAPAACPRGPFWVDDAGYGSPGGGFYWDPVSGQVWVAQRGWHLFSPAPPRPAPAPLVVGAPGYGPRDSAFYWDAVSGLVWTAERQWHRFSPQGCAAASPREATYQVEGRPVTMVNGVAEVEAAPGSASKVITRYFGNDATGDLDGDGDADVAFLLTQTSGGSGTFYYVVVAIKTPAGFVGTNAVLLGDRVAPQSTEIRGGEIVVNFAVRKPGEPMTAPPTVGQSKFLKLADGKLVER